MSLKSNYRDGDSFTRKAKREGYRSRASYKLKEILENDVTIKKGHSVLDLGSSPGGWSQVVSEIVGKYGKIAAVDLQNMDFIENCFFLLKPIEELIESDFEEIKKFLPFNLVLSDMAPNISGIKDRDNALMFELVDKTLSIVDSFLMIEGSVVIKVFQGETLDYTNIALKERFNKVKISKPKASRPNSNEIYIIGKELK
jgi:23S rRNA (uridine2552-2'-O)-methyltransferase